jgi:hypothetical protein
MSNKAIARAPFMVVIQEREEKADRNGPDTTPLDLARGCFNVAQIERLALLPCRSMRPAISKRSSGGMSAIGVWHVTIRA